MTRTKKTSITVDRDDFEERIRDYFNHTAEILDIPRGEFLSRAMYLACLEFFGENTMQATVDTMRQAARRDGQPFKEEVFLDKDGWKQHVRDLPNRRHDLDDP